VNHIAVKLLQLPGELNSRLHAIPQRRYCPFHVRETNLHVFTLPKINHQT